MLLTILMWYVILLAAANLVLGAFLIGKPRTGKYTATAWLVNLLLLAPVVWGAVLVLGG